MKTCAKCQALCEDHMKFCLNCGEPFPEAAVPEEAVEESVPELTLEPAFEAEETPAAVDEEAALAAELAAVADEVKEETIPELILEPVEEAKAPAAAPEVKPAEAAEAAKPAAEAAAAAGLSAAELKAAEKAERAEQKAIEKEAKRIEAAKAKAEETARKRAEKAAALRKKAAGRQPMSVLAVLSIIFSLIGIFAGGYACILSFVNFGLALIFYIPAVLGIIFGALALRNTGKDMLYRGRTLAFFGVIIGAIAIVLWIIGTFLLRHYTAVEFGSLDIMSAIRTIVSKV